MGGAICCLSLSPTEGRGYVGFTGHPTSALIWLHGLGDTERNWRTILTDAVLPTIEAASGSCMLVAPRAPRAPVTCNFGNITGRWFDMKELPVNASNKDNNYGCSWIDAQSSARKVHGIIDEIRSHGIPAERIAVGGFSQGAAVAILSALQYSEPLACCVAFSGLLLGGDQLSSLVSQENQDLDILWCHGEHDRIILPSLQRVGCAALERVGVQVDQRRYPIGHSTHPDALAQAADFLLEHFEATTPCDEMPVQLHNVLEQRINAPRQSPQQSPRQSPRQSPQQSPREPPQEPPQEPVIMPQQRIIPHQSLFSPRSSGGYFSYATPRLQKQGYEPCVQRDTGVHRKRKGNSTCRMLARTKEGLFGTNVRSPPPIEQPMGDAADNEEQFLAVEDVKFVTL